jgi:hypothetical protein
MIAALVTLLANLLLCLSLFAAYASDEQAIFELWGPGFPIT